jgi:hypothetical protein
MQLNINSLMKRVFAGSAVLPAALTLMFAHHAQAQVGTDWQVWGQNFGWYQQVNGPYNTTQGCTGVQGFFIPSADCGDDTSSQVMSNKFTFTFRKAVYQGDNVDWYLVTGPFTHSVGGTGYQEYSANFGKGWYGDNMTMNVTATTATGGSASLYQAEPMSTSESTTTSYSMGVGVDTGGGSGNLGYSASFTAPDVLYNTTINDSSASFNITLPGIGYLNGDLSAPSPATPLPTSKSSAEVDLGLIFSVPHNQGLTLNVTNNTEWDFWAWSASRSRLNLGGTGMVTVDFTGKTIQDWLGRCLTPAGKLVEFTACIPYDSAQLWDYSSTSQILNEQSGLCLDIQGTPGAAPQEGSFLAVSPCTNQNPNQDWVFETTMSSQGHQTLRSISSFVVWSYGSNVASNSKYSASALMTKDSANQTAWFFLK